MNKNSDLMGDQPVGLRLSSLELATKLARSLEGVREMQKQVTAGRKMNATVLRGNSSEWISHEIDHETALDILLAERGVLERKLTELGVVL